MLHALFHADYEEEGILTVQRRPKNLLMRPYNSDLRIVIMKVLNNYE